MKQSPYRKSHRVFRTLVSSSAILALAAVCQADVKLAPVPNSVRQDLTGVFLPFATNPSERISLAISLKLKDADGLEKYAKAVSDPSSPLYRQFLSPEQVGARFGADRDDIVTVVRYLEANGIKVNLVPKNNMTILAEGTAQQVESTFKTRVVHVNLGGEDVRTNATSLNLPATVANKIVSIDGVDNSIRKVHRATTTTFRPPLYWGCYNMGPARASGYYGQGRNIAFANFDGLKLNNLPYWYSAYSLPTPAGGVGSNVHIVSVASGTQYNTTTPQGEGDLDLQMEAMAAPLADIYIYDTSTTDSAQPVSTYTRIVNDNIADIVSESYGWSTYKYSKSSKTTTYYNTTCVASHNQHLSMTAQGITYMAATGDTGTAEFVANSTTANTTRYGYPAIEPEVLQVGGTIATVDSTTGARSVEKSWGASGGYGGTGGFDPYDTVALGFTMNSPAAWQTAKLPTQTSKYPYRLLPDISAQASGSDGLTTYAWIIYYNQGNTNYPLGTQIQISGTSASSPAVAGSLGIVEQRLFNGVTPTANRSNVRLGRIADYLYTKGGNASVFYDVTQGTSIGNLPGVTPAVAATPAVGWDFATGWGALDFDGLYHSYFQGKKP